jgi:Putative Ig domain/Fibronectin type III domain
MVFFISAGALRPRHGIVCALTAVALAGASSADAATAFKLSGAPAATVVAAHYFSFQPGLSNPAGTRLTFAVSHQPSWARFDSTTGRLYGTPLSPSNVGTYSNIVVSASGAGQSSVLPAYSITVLPLPNSPPTISGNAAATVPPGQAYSFQPTAKDPNGLRITYGIYNKPAWLTFDSATGRLYGTPGVNNVGAYANIVITAYDGYSKGVLPAFAITVQASQPPATTAVTPTAASPVTVQWLPPTQNTDGSALTNLAGYRVYYGTATTNLDHTATISNPGLARYVLGDLAPATWYFAMTAYSSNGQESDRSEIESLVTR